jgi:hypothetical protein
MYRHVQTACGRNGNAPVCGGKCFLMTPISSITKKGSAQTCTNSLWQEWPMNAPVCGEKCFLMMSISSITKKGNVQSCTNSLYHEFDSVWHFHKPYTCFSCYSSTAILLSETVFCKYLVLGFVWC